jgi:O-antigen ligase
MTTGALGVGMLLAMDQPKGIGLVLGLCWIAVALLDLALAVALWIPLLFLADLPHISTALHAASILIVVAWLGTAAAQRSATARYLSYHGRVIGAFALLVAWLLLSLAWAEHPGAAGKTLVVWLTSLILFVVVTTTARSRRDVELVLMALVLGTALSALVGMAVNGVTGYSAAADTLTEEGGRLRGGIGDPNYLAASIVAAVPLAVGLLGTSRSRRARATLVVAIVVLVAGLAASGSRGGLIGGGVGIVAAVVLVRHGRGKLLGLVALLVALAAAWFVVTPTAWKHVTSPTGGGTGRSSIAKVALRAAADHPLVGVGLANYPLVAPRYVRRPGQLDFVNFIAERQHQVHNAYLQVLVETGPLGLALMLMVVSACLLAAWRARRRFQQLGEHGLAGLATAALVGGAGTLSAALFIPSAQETELWLMLAAGPMLLALANRRASRVAQPARPSRRASTEA